MMKPTTARTSLGLVVLAGALFIGSGLQACGGASAQKAGAGTIPTSTPTTAKPGQSIATETGQQVAVSDAPSSAGVPASERPKMNDAAKEPYMAALDAFGRGDLAGAKTLFTEALSKDPKAYQAHYSLGVVLERMGDGEALSQYRQAFSLVPDYEPALTAYPLLLARRGNLGEADQFLTDKHAKMPKSAAITAALAEVKSMQRDTTTAQQLAQEALKLNPNYAPAMVTLARDHYRNRRLDLAQYALQAILDGFGPENPPRDKENAEARLLRALILKEESRRSAAIAELEKVVQARPDIVDAGVQLGTYYLDSGNADKALPLFERALQYDKSNMIAHLNAGDAYRLLGRVADAKREFDWVLAKDSTQAQVYYNLGLLYLFSSSVPGMTPVQQADAAIQAFEKYKAQKSRTATNEGDDVEQLITQAKAKKGALEANASAAAPAAPAASSAKPAGSAASSAKPAAS